ncbi:MAG: hypothetical protein L0Z50_16125 [Verrucomicrobiales bacterium]|nr:hypothetical protein [Verrucomicrobiales bacterium]
MKLPDSFPVEVKRGNVTVKIYRTDNKGYEEFKLVYYGADGKRKFKAFANYADAKSEADKVNASFSTGNAETLVLSSKEAAIYRRTLDILRPLSAELDLAAREYADAKAILGSDSIKDAATYYLKHCKALVRRTVQEVVDELIEKKNGKRASHDYVTDLRSRLDAFAGAFQCPITDVTAHDVEKYIASIQSEERTKFNHARLIRTLFNFAQSRKYFPRDIDPLELVDMDHDDDGEIQIFAPAELSKLIEKCPPDVLPFLVFGAFAGIRHEELKRLQWDAIKWEAGHIEIKARQSKNRRRGGRARRLIPIQPNLAQWLAPYRRHAGPIAPYANMSKQILWLAEDAGVIWKHNGLRHSFVSYRMAVLKNENAVAIEAGNSPQMIYAHYRELVTEVEAKEWFSISPKV